MGNGIRAGMPGHARHDDDDELLKVSRYSMQLGTKMGFGRRAQRLAHWAG